MTLSATGTYHVRNAFRYRSYVYDEETGFYFCNTRYYNPQWRRWLNADAMFIAGDALNASNMYAYYDGNPVMLVDPTGTASYYHPLGWQPYIPWWLTALAVPFGGLYGGFGAKRDNGRYHAGIDFIPLLSFISFGLIPATVYAIADGTVLGYEEFTKDVNGNPTSYALVVQNDDGTVVRYGEITSELRRGKRVTRGKPIGKTKTWKNGNMLHLEFYQGGNTTGPLTQRGNTTYDDPNVPNQLFDRRRDLLDPTWKPYLRW